MALAWCWRSLVFLVVCFGIPCCQGFVLLYGAWCRPVSCVPESAVIGAILCLCRYCGRSFLVLSVWGVLISFWSVLVLSPTLLSLLFLLLFGGGQNNSTYCNWAPLNCLCQKKSKCKTIHLNTSSAYRFTFTWIKVIFIEMVLHKDHKGTWIRLIAHLEKAKSASDLDNSLPNFDKHVIQLHAIQSRKNWIL